MTTLEINCGLTIDKGLDFILGHFEEPIGPERYQPLPQKENRF